MRQQPSTSFMETNSEAAPPPPPPTRRPPRGVKGKENSRSRIQEEKSNKDAKPRGGLLRRLSDRSVRKKESKQNVVIAEAKETLLPPANPDDIEPEEDPVMALFEARSTQRVRFTLEGTAGEVDRKEPRGDGAKDSTDGGDDEGEAGNGAGFNIKSFMSRILFNKASNKEAEERDDNADEDVSDVTPIVWATHDVMDESPEVVHTTNSSSKGSPLKMSFSENAEVRGRAVKLLSKARRAQFSHYRYRYAVRCLVKANEILTEAKYPIDHPLMIKTLRSLNNAYHAVSCFDNSANIVKMGIKHEESGDLVRALKMYTIAYRIRRDQISRTHPSLMVLLNILGSIQVKRGELKEALQIYELALKDAPVMVSIDPDDEDVAFIPSSNLLARAVTFREMGIIYEKWGDPKKALHMYHRSLDSISQWREKTGAKYRKPEGKPLPTLPPPGDDDGAIYDPENIQLTKSFAKQANEDTVVEHGEMEVFISLPYGQGGGSEDSQRYSSFFPGVKESTSKKRKKKVAPTGRDAYADVDVALTLHQIAQMHKKQGHFDRALDAYKASLRGMKHALGDIHPNVAAILGNIGNLQKEIGDFDAAYDTYQDVLGIESYRLGVSHPEVAISLHNVATIEAARGNYETALTIFKKVINLQRKLFGGDNLAVAITSTSMGDVYERLGDMGMAIDCYEEALRAKSAVLGRHDLQIGRMLHKLGKMAFAQHEYNLADSYTSRAVLIYRLNKISDDHAWLIDAERDAADIDAAVALGAGRFFEC